MTNPSRPDVFRLLAYSMLLILPAISRAQQLPPVAIEMAKTFGLDSFDQVEAIRFTWGIEGVLARTWEWQPKTDTVSYEGKDKNGKPVKATYRRGELGSQSDAIKNEIDPAFLNDQYWVLLPLHVVWDGASVTDEGRHEMPLSKKPAELIVVKYASGGYSPGDTWELYVGADKRIEEMTYHRAVPASGQPNLVHATWAGYEKAGPLLISTDHPATGDGQPFRITLTNVSVRLTGSNTWANAR